MVSWRVVMLFLDTTKCYPNSTRGSKYRMIFWPPLDIFTPNESMTKFFCISYLLDKIIILKLSMISWIIIMLVFWHYQKLSQLDPGVKISYDILTPPRYFHPQWIDDEVFFAFHNYLIRSLYWNHINGILNSYNAFILTLPKAIPTRPGGQNIVQYFDPPTRYLGPTTPQIIDEKLLFAFHFYWIRSIIISKLYQWFLE